MSTVTDMHILESYYMDVANDGRGPLRVPGSGPLSTAVISTAVTIHGQVDR